MRRQALGLGQTQGSRRDGGKTLRADPLDAHPLQEIVETEPRRKARGAAGRQDVVRPGDIIAERFRRIVAEEDRAEAAS